MYGFKFKTNAYGGTKRQLVENSLPQGWAKSGLRARLGLQQTPFPTNLCLHCCGQFPGRPQERAL